LGVVVTLLPSVMISRQIKLKHHKNEAESVRFIREEWKEEEGLMRSWLRLGMD